MTDIDTDTVLGHLRDVGADLCVTYWQQEPAIELDDMHAALRRIDGAAADALRRGLAHAYPRIGWLEGEADDIDAEVVAARGEYWICDAIDGAVQYVRTIPHWSMSLTLMRERVPQRRGHPRQQPREPLPGPGRHQPAAVREQGRDSRAAGRRLAERDAAR